MSTDAAWRRQPLSPHEQLASARDIIRSEGSTLLALADRLQAEFCEAVELVTRCGGNVIVTGMGKAGLIGRKISATLGSTGTSSHYVHPGEAVHGDLGRIHSQDVVLALSFSGETQETVQLIPALRELGIPLIAITRSDSSCLGRAADVVLGLGPIKEACSLGLAPSTSTTAMLALGDALALVVSQMKRFDRDDFARFHPGGSLGLKLAKVDDMMRPLGNCRIAQEIQTVRQVLVQASRPGRRTGAIMLVDPAGRLTGVFTDSDLARMLERADTQNVLDAPIERVMTREPATIQLGTRLTDAIDLLAIRKISELPIVDGRGMPVGLIDITDVVSLTVESNATESSSRAIACSSEVEQPAVVPFPRGPRG